ncbi:MAG: EVE domain-containing protein [Patescibacteria group bacterium]
MANYFLAKSDPDSYSIDDFEREVETNWDGVHNYAAIKVIKSWKIGDLVLIYHSQGENSIVGISKVTSSPIKDKDDPRGISWCARLKLIRKYPTSKRISLKEIKASGLFPDFALVRQSRLSTMACPDSFIEWLKQKGVNIA